jgi:OmpA-OmpF porin, OOP family
MKMAKATFLTSLAFVFMSSGAMAAEAAYNADQIVEMFIKSADLGKSRAICIGTADECTAKRNAPSEAVNMKINFEYNSVDLTTETTRTIEEFAKAINDERLTVASFEVNGFTDAFGTDEFNLDLSKRRAEKVVETLVALGVGQNRIKANGFGETKPSVTDPFAADNRRVEALIVMPSN